MKLSKFVLLTFISAVAAHSAHAQSVENMDFAKGKANWQGDGKVVFIDAEGKVSAENKPGTTQVIAIELSKSAWRGLRQKLRPKNDDTKIDVALQVKADKTFKKEEESRQYSKVDFKEGGQYGWSAEVYPKCDFLVRVKSDGWQYRPISLAPIDAWKSIDESFSNLKGRQREVELLFPPGEGTVYLKAK